MRARSLRDYDAFADAVRERGDLIAGDALQRPATARTVRPRHPPGHRRLFAESAEQLGGFDLIDVPDLDVAVDLARLLPRECSVEVRPTLGIDI